MWNMTKFSFEAFIFDLDGVITQTALVHSEAWKRMFDEFLQEREKKYGEPFREFTHQADYLPYVDGKPRYKGVASFLESRGINIPFGDASDAPHLETVCALGNRKDLAFRKILETEGVKEYATTVALIRELKAKGIRVGVASSSKNCRLVLESTGLLSLFETRVDGEVSAELGLKGKPRPDIFTVAADNLGVAYDRTVIVEDAVSGVQAGREGNFGLVLGIAREGNAAELKDNGADIVVSDLGEITLSDVEKWFNEGLENDGWTLAYHDYDAGKESVRESLLVVGNGYLGTRGSAEEMKASGPNYPGTYLAGLYNRLSSKVADRVIFNEDFVNIPNWQYLTFKVEDGNWIDINKATFHEYERKLDFRTGKYSRKYVVEDEKGRATEVISERIASMDDPHLVAISYSVRPLNYSGRITLLSGLDGNIVNGNVERYKQLSSRHLDCVKHGVDGATGHIMLRTTQSRVNIAEAVRLSVRQGSQLLSPAFRHHVDNGAVYHEFTLPCTQGETYTTEKIVAIYTSKDQGIEDPSARAQEAVRTKVSFDNLYERSAACWEKLWQKADVKVEGDRLAQKLLRLHIFHTLATTSYHNLSIDASIPARGLHGEAYRGHIFWDELFVLPFYNLHFPDITKAVLMYRYRRLDKARAYAKEYGYKGAMFPWQSGSDGSEETQTLHLNPLTGQWGDDYSSYQRHVSLAIALNVWQYYQMTDDKEFMRSYGAEMMLSISKFFASLAHLNEKTGRYEIKNVMGPDEYHEHHENCPKGGLKDNSYTNIMVAWLLDKSQKLLELFAASDKKELLAKADVADADFAQWQELMKKLNLVIKDGVISQFDGYFDLPELPWEEYRKKYGNIHRMDRILKAEGKSPDAFKVAKQADLLMTFYNLPLKEVEALLQRLGYAPEEDFLKVNYDYYIKRTSHGSTLSKIVHAQLANLMGDARQSFELYFDALQSDYRDVQGGTTGEGIHAGVMSSTVLVAVSTYAGLDLRGDHIVFNPVLPRHWRRMKFSFQYQGDDFDVEVDQLQVAITPLKLASPRNIEVKGQKVKMEQGTTKTIKL
jgi:beta-phosphoglucomutase family hydrolase